VIFPLFNSLRFESGKNHAVIYIVALLLDG